ncbi:MAG: phenylalanine--tRNA ligase subunit alpha, partial [Planctomycetota bacterium]
MSLAQFVTDLDGLVDEAQAAFSTACDDAQVESARVEFLGAKAGRLKSLQKGMGAVDKADKPAAGKKLNEVKAAVEAAFVAAQARIAASGQEKTAEAFDPTLPGIRRRLGRLHPITQTIAEMKDIMGRLGFTAVEGPEIEDDWHNFEALNIPESHPARDPLENFYLATAAAGNDQGPLLLRSQTSTVQIRVMEQNPPPVRVISLGRVYRPDTADATHYPMFH